eukprot:Phypoly_transcript_06490.p1 GENE.Phypoly_transcript_06490~~Phypoly_transcript_06490.p1  ORF type:complete len:554 (+),score=166.49 Phypoly_transcript_06490:121-1782(+)
MYIARRQALGTPFILRRRVVGKRPSNNLSVTIAENTRKLKAYQTMVHSRMLWEQSSNEDNRGAFKQVQTVRDLKDRRMEGDNWSLHAFEAPEKHLNKDAKKIKDKFAKVLHQERDAPLEINPNQLWYSPEELMPVEEGQNPYVAIDDDEVDNTFMDRDETFDDTSTKKVELKLEEARKKLHYYERLEEEASYDPLKEGDELEKVFREDSAKLDLMDFPDTEYRPAPDSIPTREQDMMTEIYDRETESTDGPRTEDEDAPVISDEEAEMLAEDPGAEGEDDWRENFDEEQAEEEEDEEDNPKAKKCVMCGENAPKLDVMNVYLLSRFVSAHGDIFPRKLTGTCLRHQRDIGHIYRKAKGRGLITFKRGFELHIPYEEPTKNPIRPDVIKLNRLAEEIGEEDVAPEEREELAEADKLLRSQEEPAEVEQEDDIYLKLSDSIEAADEADQEMLRARRRAGEKETAKRLREPKRVDPDAPPRNAKDFAKARRGESERERGREREREEEEEGRRGRRPGGDRRGGGERRVGGGRGGGRIPPAGFQQQSSNRGAPTRPR